MAGAARLSRLNVHRRLGQCIGTNEGAVMAGITIGDRHPDKRVDRVTASALRKAGRLLGPRSCSGTMAHITSGRRRDMCIRLSGRPSPRTRMASCARTWRPPEHTRGMTGLALHKPVRRIEHVARCIVIKRKALCRLTPGLPKRFPPLPHEHHGRSQ